MEADIYTQVTKKFPVVYNNVVRSLVEKMPLLAMPGGMGQDVLKEHAAIVTFNVVEAIFQRNINRINFANSGDDRSSLGAYIRKEVNKEFINRMVNEYARELLQLNKDPKAVKERVRGNPYFIKNKLHTHAAARFPKVCSRAMHSLKVPAPILGRGYMQEFLLLCAEAVTYEATRLCGRNNIELLILEPDLPSKTAKLIELVEKEVNHNFVHEVARRYLEVILFNG